MAHRLLKAVRSEIEAFFNDPGISNTIFNNEGHFQAYLYNWLLKHLPKHEGCKNANVYIEYYVPIHSFEYQDNGEKKTSYEWGKSDRIYIDLVVECDGCFVPIELKYKTEALEDSNYTRFGETICSTVTTNQIATNMGYYDCWQDVKRLELLAERFPNIVGGLFVFLSNNHLYIYPPTQKGCKSQNFAWHERPANDGPVEKKWADKYKYDDNKRPNLTFAKDYGVSWTPKLPDRKDHDPKVFRHCVIEIDGNDVRTAKLPTKAWVQHQPTAKHKSE